MEEIVKNNRIVELGIPKLTEAAQSSQDKIVKAILAHLEKYPQRGGKFVWDKENTKLLSKLAPQLQKALEGADFEGSMLRYFDDFDQLGQNIKDVHNRLNGIKIPVAELQAEKELIIESTINGLVRANMNQSFLIPVKQGLFNKIRFGASVTETESYIRGLIQGGEEAGTIERWVGQVARDAANQYEGTLHQKVKEEYNLKNWEYLGAIQDNSRKQCIRWMEMGTIPDEILAEEIEWAFNYGRGMIDGTDPSTFGIFRGGHNCLHSAVPVK